MNRLRFIKNNPEFAKLWTATMVSRFGDSLDMIAFSWIVLELTGSTMAMGTYYILNFLPNVLLGPFAGVLADRLDRRKLIIFSDLSRGVTVFTLAIWILTGNIQIWVLYLATLINSTLESFAFPSKNAVIPQTVKKEDLGIANSMRSMATTLATIFGLAAGGVVIGFIGKPAAFFIDSGTFFVSAFLITIMKLPKRSKISDNITVKKFFGEFMEGIRFVWKLPILKFCLLITGVANFAFLSYEVLLPPWIKLELELGVESLSIVQISVMVAIVFGTILAGYLSKNSTYPLMMIMGIGINAFGYFMMYFVNDLWFTVVFFGICGLGTPMISTALQTLIHLNTPDEKMGRVSSISTTIVLAIAPLSAGIFGFLGELLPIKVIFSASGVILGAVTLALINSRIMKMEAKKEKKKFETEN